MADKLSAYSVLEVLPGTRSGEACYKVKHKHTKSLFIWKAYDSKNLKPYQLDGALNEVKLINTFENLQILKYFETILHPMSNTLYVVTEFTPHQKLSDLIEKCNNDNVKFDETFIWNILYQLTVISKSLANVKVNIFRKQINPSAIFIDPDLKIKIDPFYLKIDCKPSETTHFCSNKACEVGLILYEMCTLKKRSGNDTNLTNFHYSEEILCMVKMLLHKKTVACNLELDVILHHPTVLFNITSDSKTIFKHDVCLASPTLSQDSAFESDESTVRLNSTLIKSSSVQNLTRDSQRINLTDNADFLETKSIDRKNASSYFDINLSPTLAALDLKLPGYVPSKMCDNVGKWKSRLELYKEPEEVGEQALSRVWMKRLAELCEREEALRLKEHAIDTKQRFQEVACQISSDLKNDKLEPSQEKIKDMTETIPGITLQTAMNQKVLKPETVQTRPVKTITRLSLSDGSVVSNIDQRDLRSKRIYRRSSSVRARYRKKKTISYIDMDSSLSADQGDNSFLPTSSKISADLVPRPSSMHNIAKRKVHFNPKRNPFADYGSISSTTLTFFEIENIDGHYETPNSMPAPTENIADRIAKFTYLDLEAMTNQKRALMEQWANTPPKVNRNTKPSNLGSKIKAAENIRKINNLKNSLLNDTPLNLLDPKLSIHKDKFTGLKSTKCPVSSRKSFGGSYSENCRNISGISSSTTADEKRQTISTVKLSVSDSMGNKENANTPGTGKLKKDSKRMSILGFKTPFKLRI